MKPTFRNFFNASIARRSFVRGGPFLLLLMMLSGCALLTELSSPAGSAPSVSTVQVSAGRISLEKGLLAYENGLYELASGQFRSALDQGLMVPEQLSAHKHLAFIYCVSGRERQCGEEFRKAFDVDAGFELAPAELGHPLWGPVFKRVKAGRKTDSRK